MRRELDLRIMALKGGEQEFQAFGKALIERIRFYIKAYYGRLDRSNSKHSVDGVAGSEYFYDSQEELERKVKRLKLLAKENEENLILLKQAIDEVNQN